MLLTSLPHDILTSLPSYLHSFQDLSSVLLTCRTLHATCSSPTPAQLTRLTEAPKTGLHPQPHLFIAIKARKLGEWAVDKAHPERRATLQHAITGGPAMLLKLALEVSPLSLSDYLRTAWVVRTVINPITIELDIECGVANRNQRRQDRCADDDDDRISMLTVCEDVGLALLNYWTYCDLFYHTILPPELFTPDTAHTVEPLERSIRLDWFHYCVPDNNDQYHVPEGEFQQLDLQHLLHFFLKRLRRELGRNGQGLVPGRREIWFHSIASHMGLASLRLLMPRENDDDGLPRDIKRTEEAMANMEIPEGRFLLSSRNYEDRSVVTNEDNDVDEDEAEDSSEDEERGEDEWLSLMVDIMDCWDFGGN